MEFLTCKRCKRQWCHFKLKRAVKCAKCGSAYWDQEWILGPRSPELSTAVGVDKGVSVVSEGPEEQKQESVSLPKVAKRVFHLPVCPADSRHVVFPKADIFWCADCGRRVM